MPARHPGLLLSSLLLALLHGCPAVARDARCGSYCLYVALKSLGLAPASFEDLELRLGDPDQGGYTMHQLEQAAHDLGARTIAVRTTLENLEARTEPFACIALINGSHFVLLYDSDRSSVRVCDPPDLKQIPASTFRASWSGEALLIGTSAFRPEEQVEQARKRRAFLIFLVRAAGILFLLPLILLAARSFLRRLAPALAPCLLSLLLGLSACSPRAPVGGPDRPPPAQPTSHARGLRAVPSEVDLGIIRLERPNQTILAEASLRNEADHTIKVEAIIPNCACTSAHVEPTIIKPGASAKLEVTIRVANSSEDAATQVLIQTADNRDQPLPVVFTWKPRNPLYVETPQFTLQGVRPGQSASQGMPLRLVGLSLCTDCRFDLQSDHPRLRHHLQVNALPRDGHEALTPGEDRLVGELRVSTIPSDAEENLEARLVVTLRCGDTERARLDLPVVWMVVPAIGASPRRFFLGSGPPGQLIRRKLVLSAATGHSFAIRDVAAEAGRLRITAVDHPSEPRSAHVLELGLTAPTSAGSWTDIIVVRTDSSEQPTVLIPVAGVVSDQR